MSISSKIRILLIDAEGTAKEDVADQLANNTDFDIQHVHSDKLPAQLSDSNIDVIVVDLSKLEGEEKALLEDLRAQAPEMPLIVVSEDLGTEGMRQLFRFNVEDWLHKPVDPKELESSVKSSVRSNKFHSNRVHAVVSTVGGAGATSIAVSMADIAATKLLKKKGTVALFDLDFSTGNCGYLLNMASNVNLGSVVAAPRRIDTEFISVIQQKHENGFYLYSFKRPELTTEMNGYELVLRLLDAVTIEHTTTFLDVPYYETEWKDDVFSAVNTCTLVTELNLPALKHTLDVVDRVQKLRGEDFPIRVLINKRANSLFGQRISKSKLRSLFGDTPFYYIQRDEATLGEAADRGVVPSEIAARSQFIKSLTKYMKSIELLAEPGK